MKCYVSLTVRLANLVVSHQPQSGTNEQPVNLDKFALFCKY